jgi:hypothetical protein
LAVGDAHIRNDPLLGQGATAAPTLPGRVEGRISDCTSAVTRWTNVTLLPPAPYTEVVRRGHAEVGHC